VVTLLLVVVLVRVVRVVGLRAAWEVLVLRGLAFVFFSGCLFIPMRSEGSEVLWFESGEEGVRGCPQLSHISHTSTTTSCTSRVIAGEPSEWVGPLHRGCKEIISTSRCSCTGGERGCPGVVGVVIGVVVGNRDWR